MCIEISVTDGPLLERCDQLWKLVGRENVVFTHEADFLGEDCLCHVDVDATAKKAGYKSRPGWNEAGVDYIWDAPGEELPNGVDR